jgi:hypothetical protein
MTLIPSILREIRTYYKKACGNENSCVNENVCGNAVLISPKIDGINLLRDIAYVLIWFLSNSDKID